MSQALDTSLPPEQSGLATAHCEQCGALVPCACAHARALIAARAVQLESQGLQQASARCFCAARTSLEEASELQALSGSAMIALGLCYWTAGDLAAVESVWKGALRAPDVSARAARLLETLRSDDTSRALEAYTKALTAARQGNFVEARSQVALVRTVLPDLEPAARLAVLIAPEDQQRELVVRYRDCFRDHSVPIPSLLADSTPTASLRRSVNVPAGGATASLRWSIMRMAGIAIVGVLIGVVGTRSLISVPPRSGPGNTPAQVAPVLSADTARSIREMGATPPTLVRLALSDKTTDLAALIDSLRADGKRFSPAETTLVARRLADAARAAYRQSRRLLAIGDTGAAIEALKDAVLVVDAYYADDALYALAVSLSQRGQSKEAAAVAQKLLTRYPRSIYGNSIARRIADGPRVTKP